MKAIARPGLERRAIIAANAQQAAEIAAFAASHKKCPRCAEMVKAEAIVCRFCQNEFPAPRPTLATVNAAPPPDGRYLVRCINCGRDWIRGTRSCPNCGGYVRTAGPPPLTPPAA